MAMLINIKVSKAAERSKMQRHDTFLWSDDINETTENVKKSCFSAVMFTIDRLVELSRLLEVR